MDSMSKTKSKSGVSKDDILSTLDNFQSAIPITPGIENKENNNTDKMIPKPEPGGQDGYWDFLDLPDVGPAPASLSHSYSMEWDKLFTRPEKMMQRLKEKALEGDLRSSRFRSVVWKLFLEVLPPSLDKWVEKSRETRAKFEDLKNRLIVNPRKAVDSVNLRLNNPLSQDEESPWNKFFQDNELRLTIKQDVIRTFPEVEFFRSSGMIEMMLDILFCFSREHATHSYKQGMHELLAPLIFVLHCDHQAFLHACEIESVLDIMKEVMDPAYLEHDAYSMFCQVMETVEPWYLSREYYPKSGSMRSLEIINATPFARSQDLNPSSAIVTKLTRIQDYVLKKFDPELHQHLERLEIAPQIYGIRWLRLLFGREFPMQDILMLWDAIFGDGIGFDLVDYIFVAMLLYIRAILIASDYTNCLTILMKYPAVADVHYFVVKALFLREPNQYVRPPNYFHQGSISMLSSSDSINAYDNFNTNQHSSSKLSNSKKIIPRGAHSQKRQGPTIGGFSSFSRKFSRPRTLSVSTEKNMPKSSSEPMNLQTDASPEEPDHPLGSTVSLSQVEESMLRHTPSSSSLARMEMTTARSAQSSPGVHHTSQIFPLTPEDTSEMGSPTKYNTLPNKWSKKKQKKLTSVEKEYQDKLIHLQGQLNDKETMCRYCASKLDVHIDSLQQDLSKRNLDVGDELMVSLAGIKLVRDILNGTLKFNQTMGDDIEELAINDSYYEREGDANLEPISKGSEPMSPDSDILLGAASSEMMNDHHGKTSSLYISSEDVSPEVPPRLNELPADLKNMGARHVSDFTLHTDPLDCQQEQILRKNHPENEKRDSHNYSTSEIISSQKQAENRSKNQTPSDDGNTPQLTSRIRNIFKSSQKPQRKLPSNVASSTGSGKVVEDYTDTYPKSSFYDDRKLDIDYEDQRSTREPTSGVSNHRSDYSRHRSRSTIESVRQHPFCKSDEYPSSYHPHHNRRGSRGSVGSDGSAGDFVMVGDLGKEVDERYPQKMRERSRSQPINPLYALKYEEGMDC